MRHITLLTATLLLTLTGCGDDTKQKIKETVKETASFKTVQYYLDHKVICQPFLVQRIKQVL